MDPELLLRRKWTLRAHGRQVVFVKRPREKTAHVVMKALLWALYLPEHPDLSVEVSVGGRYKPDVVAFGEEARPRFWGAAGEVALRKIRALALRYPDTHIALAKWDTRLEPFTALVRKALGGSRRKAPFDLIRFPRDSVEQFIDVHGTILIAHSDLDWVRLEPENLEERASRFIERPEPLHSVSREIF